MKYLKRFNEELNPDTYLKVAKKLQKYNHPERAKNLEKHALNIDYSKYGTFNLIENKAGYNRSSNQRDLTTRKITPSFIEVGEYNLSSIGFEIGMTSDNFPIENLYFYVVFNKVEDEDRQKVLNIIVPYKEGEFRKSKIEFWDDENVVLFADGKSAVKLKKALYDFVYKSKAYYNEVEYFPLKETLYRQLDDLSKDPEMEFKFDDDSFTDLLKYITLDHISINGLYSTNPDRFKLPLIIE